MTNIVNLSTERQRRVRREAYRRLKQRLADGYSFILPNSEQLREEMIARNQAFERALWAGVDCARLPQKVFVGTDLAGDEDCTVFWLSPRR